MGGLDVQIIKCRAACNMKEEEEEEEERFLFAQQREATTQAIRRPSRKLTHTKPVGRAAWRRRPNQYHCGMVLVD